LKIHSFSRTTWAYLIWETKVKAIIFTKLLKEANSVDQRLLSTSSKMISLLLLRVTVVSQIKYFSTIPLIMYVLVQPRTAAVSMTLTKSPATLSGLLFRVPLRYQEFHQQSRLLSSSQYKSCTQRRILRQGS
jgi:hypothetical protein